jgi:hypothetical protein
LQIIGDFSAITECHNDIDSCCDVFTKNILS